MAFAIFVGVVDDLGDESVDGDEFGDQVAEHLLVVFAECFEAGECGVEGGIDKVVVLGATACEELLERGGNLVDVDHGVVEEVTVDVVEQVYVGGDRLGALIPGAERFDDVFE